MKRTRPRYLARTRRRYVPLRPRTRWWWPFARRRDVELAYDALETLLEDVRAREKALANLGHRMKERTRAQAQLVSDLRLIRVHVEYPHRVGERVGFSVQMPEFIFDGFRRDVEFRDILSTMIEQAMWREPEGRKLIAGIGGPSL